MRKNKITNSRKSPFITNGLFLLIIIVLQITAYRMNDSKTHIYCAKSLTAV